MPVLVAQHRPYANVRCATFNEGRRNTAGVAILAQGAPERLRWIRDTLGPAMAAAIGRHGPLDIFEIVAQGLQMGDECHARSAACTALLVKRLMPSMLEADVA